MSTLTEPRIVPDVPPIAANEPESPRCACCGAVMPKDDGQWYASPAIAGVGVHRRLVGLAFTCSRECDEQMWEGA